MSSITGTCGNTARAQMEQYLELLQQQRLEKRLEEQRLEEHRAANRPAVGQPTGLNAETGVRNVAEPGKGLLIDLYA